MNETTTQNTAPRRRRPRVKRDAAYYRKRARQFHNALLMFAFALIILIFAAANLIHRDRDVSESENRTENLRAQLEEKAERLRAIEAEADELNRAVDDLLEQVRSLAASADSAAQETVALQARETLALSAAAEDRVKLSALQASVDGVADRRAVLEHDLEESGRKLEEAEADSKANRRALDEAREEAQAVSNIIQGHTLKMDGRRRRAEEAQAAKVQLTVDVGALENRIRLLTEMEKEYEGFSRAVKPGRPGCRDAEHRCGQGGGRQGGHRLSEAAGRRPGHLPAADGHPR